MATEEPRPAPPVPTEAVDYLRRKKVRQGYHYDEVWREEHWNSFTVAKAMEDDLLSDIQGSIAGAIEEGVPFEKWREEMTERLGKRGWWGYQVEAEPDEEQRAKLEANLSRRLQTIWHVNTTQAYQAGIWERGMRSPAHPYVLYSVGPSVKHREQHLAWHGTLLPRDDPFWAIAAPMNGWGCKCSVRFVSRAARERYLRDKIPGPGAGRRRAGTGGTQDFRPDATAQDLPEQAHREDPRRLCRHRPRLRAQPRRAPRRPAPRQVPPIGPALGGGGARRDPDAAAPGRARPARGAAGQRGVLAGTLRADGPRDGGASGARPAGDRRGAAATATCRRCR